MRAVPLDEELFAVLPDPTKPPAGHAPPSDVVAALTAREKDVLTALAQGHGTVDMAALLGISERTVRNYLSAIYDKLGVENRVQAVLWWSWASGASTAVGAPRDGTR